MTRLRTTGIPALLALALCFSLCVLSPTICYAADTSFLTAGTISNSISYPTQSVTKAYGAKFTNPLINKTNVAVKYASSNKKIAVVDTAGRVTTKGVGTATISASSAAGTTSYTLVVNPRKVALKSLKATSNGFSATWKKGAKADCTGYQIKYSKFRDLSKSRTKKISKLTTTTTSLKKFSGSSNCFAQVRAYAKGKDGKTYYSAWSSTKRVIGALKSGDSVLDGYINKLLKRTGTSDAALKKAFNYAVNLKYKAANTKLTGKWTIKAAKSAYKTNNGNCYEAAALFGWAAKALGYDAEICAGKFINKKADGTVVERPHGWVQIKLNGKTLYCDPNNTATLKATGIASVRGHSSYLYLFEKDKPYSYSK